MVLSGSLRVTKSIFLLLNFVALCHGAAKDLGTPIASKAAPDFPFYISFLNAYRQTVDAVVSSHINIWKFNQRHKSFDESAVYGLCENRYDVHRFSNIPSFERDQQRTKSLQRTLEGGNNTIDTAREAPNKINLDNESDIDMYFTHLKHACSQDIAEDEHGANLYKTECLGMLRSLVYDPRCTTRYDSRVKCKNEDTDYNIKSKSPGGIIQEHFREDSLNVVIIGAGPVGLFLANALTMLERASSDIPLIRILMLETRAEASGLKKPYTRNWQVMTRALDFRYTVDPRVVDILTSTTDFKGNIDEADGEFVSPLNLIETLLLLSNRDLGATKFLFGVNPLDLVDDLDEIPNLLLVDATGHRLEPLKRGTSCDDASDISKDEDVTVIENFRMPDPVRLPWQNEKNAHFYGQMNQYWYPPEHYKILRSHGLRVDIGQTGDVLYPIDEKTKSAKAIFWLEIRGAPPYTDEEAFEEQRHSKKLYASEGQFCARCKNANYENEENIEDEDEDERVYEEYHEDVDGDEDDDDYEDEDVDGDEDDDDYEDEGVDGDEDEDEEQYEDGGDVDDNEDDEGEEDDENEEEEEIDIRRFCDEMCSTEYHFDSTTLLREDISSQIRKGRFSDTFFTKEPTDDAWFTLNDYVFNPSTELAHQVETVLRKHGDHRHEVGMPLIDLLPAILQNIDVNNADLCDEDWDIVEAMRRIEERTNPNSKGPTVTLFAQLPFLYQQGIKPKNKDHGGKSSSLGDYLDNAPMIRIGDSFTIGDGLQGDGIITHVFMIGLFMDAILAEWEKNAV